MHFFQDSQTHFYRNLWISQSVSSIIDQPKMAEFSKKANLLEDFKDIAKHLAVKVSMSV